MDLPELFRTLIEHVMARTKYYGVYRYRVLEQVGDLVSCQAVGRAEKRPPDIVMLPKAHGLGGAKETLVPSTLVLVMFEGGDPGVPFVALYPPAQPLPTAITLASSETFTRTSVDITDAADHDLTILVGHRANIGGDTMVPAAVGTITDKALGTLLLGLNAARAGLTVPLPPILTLPSVQSAKVYITTGDGNPYIPPGP